MLRLYDGVEVYKVPVGSQLFELVKQSFIDKEDYIKVVDYVSTNMTPTRNALILYHIKKIVVTVAANVKNVTK